jgi:UDP-3-O-[3-hydroxymyristoyl] glucosamine N-acyltransferase
MISILGIGKNLSISSWAVLNSSPFPLQQLHAQMVINHDAFVEAGFGAGQRTPITQNLFIFHGTKIS